MARSVPTRGRSHDTTVDDTTQFGPTHTTGGAQKRGIPLFVNADTNEPEPFDPAELKAEGRINSTVLGVLGNKGHGKTATSIAIALRFRWRRAGNRRMSICINDIRRNNARPEYEKLCEYLGVEEVSLGNFRLNMLSQDLKLKPSELLTMVARSLQFELARQLTTKELKALRYSLKMVLEFFEDDAELSTLMACMRRMNEGIARRFQNQIEQGKGDKYARHLARLERVLDTKPQITPGLLETALELADTIENLLDGEYGEMFGGDHSLASVMHTNKGLVAFDFSELSDDALTQVLAMMWQVKTSAMRRGDHDLYYDIEIHDESYTLWRNLEYARSMHKFLKQVRATGTFIVMNTHRLSDYETVGSESSEQYKLATNMIDDIDMWLLGRHTPSAAEDTAKRLDLTDEEKQRLLHLERGVWGLKIGSEPVRWVYIDLTDDEAEVTYSDDANRENTAEGMNEMLARALDEEAQQAAQEDLAMA